MEEIKKLAKQLFKIRGNPIYLIKAKINEKNLLKLQKDFQDKNLEKIDIILHSVGGYIEPAFNFTKILRRHNKKIIGIIPYFAKSATTLLCLGMNELILGELGELGPIDVQIQERTEEGTQIKSALNSFKALEQIQQYALETLDIAVKLIIGSSGIKMSDAIKLSTQFASIVANPLYSQIDPYKLGENARDLDIAYQYGIRILTRYMNWDLEKAKSLLNAVVKHYPSHEFILDVEELKMLEINARYVNKDEEKIIEDLKEQLMVEKKEFVGFVFDKKNSAVNIKNRKKRGGKNGSKVEKNIRKK